jgi:hypothetical protein
LELDLSKADTILEVEGEFSWLQAVHRAKADASKVPTQRGRLAYDGRYRNPWSNPQFVLQIPGSYVDSRGWEIVEWIVARSESG